MLKELAEKYYQSGYNCAESILLAGNEAYQLNLDDQSAHLIAAFGGGLQCGDLCGCLSGAAAVLGAKYIRTKAHDQSDLLRKATLHLIKEFEKELGARKCVDIKPRLFNKEVRCLNTVIHGAIALEKTIEFIEKDIA